MPTDLTPELIRRILRLWEADDSLRIRDSDGNELVVEAMDELEAAALIRCRLEDAADEKFSNWSICKSAPISPDDEVERGYYCFYPVGNDEGEWPTATHPTRLEALVALHEARLGIEGEEKR